MTEPSTRTLTDALNGLREVARAAGLEPEAAVLEGEALAAAVVESAEQAYLDWGEQTGHSDPQAFFDAAHRGRRWRAAPTRLPITPKLWQRSVAPHRRWGHQTPGLPATRLLQRPRSSQRSTLRQSEQQPSQNWRTCSKLSS